MTRVLGVLLLLTLLWAGWAEYRVQAGDLALAELRGQQEQALKEASEKARSEERLIINRQMKVLDAAHVENQRLQAAAVRTALAAGGLRNENASLRSRLAAADAAAASQCAAPIEAARVLTGLLDQCTESYRVVAAHADNAHAAAGQCADQYQLKTDR